MATFYCEGNTVPDSLVAASLTQAIVDRGNGKTTMNVDTGAAASTSPAAASSPSQVAAVSKAAQVRANSGATAAVEGMVAIVVAAAIARHLRLVLQ